MSRKLKIMTYNIHSGVGTDGVADWKRCAAIASTEQPDLLGMEEIAVNHVLSPGLDLPALIGNYLKMNTCFGQAIRINGGRGQYGVAAFVRGKMEIMEQIFLPVADGHEKRVFLVLKVLEPEPHYFIVTHFSYLGEMENVEQYQRDSVRLITETVRKKHYYPAVWVGDFNAYPESGTLQQIRESWDVFNDSVPDIKTCDCGEDGWRMIDYICAYPKGAFELKSIRTVNDYTASDHCPVVAEAVLK